MRSFVYVRGNTYFCVHIKVMNRLHIITPVKDSIETTIDTVRAVLSSSIDVPFSYTVYNDNSTPENTSRLEALSEELGFGLVNLCELTDHPSPNYLFVLQHEQQLCRQAGAALLIVESDVTVRSHTLGGLVDVMRNHPEAGLIASVTVDELGDLNYPYVFARKYRKEEVVDTRHHLSFCCTLLTPVLLDRVDFNTLRSDKNWFDVTISHLSLRQGLHNLMCPSLAVLHRPHGSRPWKQLKYTNPLKYYWRKFWGGLDKI